MPANTKQNALPGRFPGFRFLALVLALGCGYLTAHAWRLMAGPLKPFYLARYARLSFLPHLPRADYSINKSFVLGKTFDVLLIGNSVATTANLPRLSGQVSVRTFTMEPAAFRSWLKQNIYEGQTIGQTLRWPMYLSETYLCVFFFAGYSLDVRKLRQARKGLTLRGPGLVSRWTFNRKTRGHGLAFKVSNRRNLFEFLMPGESGKFLRIPKDREAHHIQVIGDTGAGKGTIIRQIISQVEARGEVAILFDPDCEYIQEFYNEERGDVVLNPLDDRCPYWELETEALTVADATSIALAAWPDEPGQQPFFKKHPRGIFAYLISRYNLYNCPEDPATCESLARWLSNPRVEITPRVEGTQHAVSTDANAKDQSQGLWATLGEVVTSLSMMPSAEENRRKWTAREWVTDRKGWIFITSTPTTLDALRPLQSIWLDMLILKLQSPGESSLRVWMILDELAALNQLPQLHSALTRQRKYENPVVIGCQAMAQVEDAYGEKKARTILSQAFTNFILRTREPHASEHGSNMIGKAQLERLKESQPSRLFEGRRGNYNTERVIDPVVMPSELQIMDDLRGYFVQKENIVEIEFKPAPRRFVAPALIERTLKVEYPARVQSATVVEPTTTVTRTTNKAKELVFEELPLLKTPQDTFS